MGRACQAPAQWPHLLSGTRAKRGGQLVEISQHGDGAKRGGLLPAVGAGIFRHFDAGDSSRAATSNPELPETGHRDSNFAPSCQKSRL